MVTDARLASVMKLRRLGYSYDRIGNIYGTSGTTVHNWVHLNRGKYPEPERPLRPRPLDGLCEGCREAHSLYYYTWNSKYPEMGLWLCKDCTHLAEVVAVNTYLPKKLKDFMHVIEMDYARKRDAGFVYDKTG